MPFERKTKSDALVPLNIPSHVRIVAVTKGRSIQEIEKLIHQGHLWFGENRIQEIEEKWPNLLRTYPKIRLQFIGNLQRHAIPKILNFCHSIISVDRTSVLDKIAKYLPHDKNREILIQVNLSGEKQKGGCAEEELPSLLSYAKKLQLPIHGLMTMPPQNTDPRSLFRKLKELANAYHLKEVSMGMSDDYEIALQEGATQIRIGRALFI